jgi:hypothetical protein
VENKFIAYRHVAKGVFPSWTFVLASALLHVPVALVETLLFCGVLYGMTGMSGNFGVYFFTVFLFDLIMRNLLVFFTLKAKTLQLARKFQREPPSAPTTPPPPKKQNPHPNPNPTTP